MRKSTCPFCDFSNEFRALTCRNCSKPFPWIEAEDRITNLVKEREVSRMRAALTVVEDLYAAARHGKPFPVSSLKGLVFSWLLPQAVVIVGSLIGALLLAAQTYLIYQQIVLQRAQNELIARQSTLDVFEKTARFKDLLVAEPKSRVCMHMPTDKPELQVSLWPRPNSAAVRQIVRLSSYEPNATIPVVETLLVDNSAAVSYGAYQVLLDLQRQGLYQAANRFANFTGASMQGDLMESAQLPNSSFRYADLSGSSLHSSNLSGSWFTGALLRSAKFSKALLSDTDFDCADLRRADLTQADVERMDLTGADLEGANLRGLKNWKEISSIRNANVSGVENAPEGFLDWAISNGARVRDRSKPATWGGDIACYRRLPCD